MIRLSTKEKLNFLINLLMVLFLIAFAAAVISKGFVWNIQISVRRVLTPTIWIAFLIYLKYFISPDFRQTIDRFISNILKDTKKLMVMIIGFCIGVILLGLFNGLFPEIQFWNLDSEKSLATIYSGCLLLATGWMATYIYFQEKKMAIKSSWLWIPFIIIFMYLSLDEVSSIHENLGAGKQVEKIYGKEPLHKLEWLQLYIPFIIAAIGFFAYASITKIRHCRRALLALIIGVGCYVLVIACEAAMLLNDLRSQAFLYRMEVVLEESAEMLGTIFFMLSFMLYSKQLQLKAEEKKNQAVTE